MRYLIIVFVFAFFATPSLAAPNCPELTTKEKLKLYELHRGEKFALHAETINVSNPVRRAYVVHFSSEHNVPLTVSWLANKEFADAPKRKGHWKTYRADPEQAVRSSDYTNSGYHRGHLAPYFISGGDRDNDGMDAEFEDQDKYPIEDIDDACTVFEINYMSNLAPQLPEFNSQGGAWYDFETHNRERLKAGAEIRFDAGSLFVPDEEIKKIGKVRKISVPHAFWKIAWEGGDSKLYVFWNELEGDRSFGCHPKDDWQDCEVTEIAHMKEYQKILHSTLQLDRLMEKLNGIKQD